VCVAAGTGIALLPESLLDVVGNEGLARHPLPAVFANVGTPLIWRAKEAIPAITALQGLLTKSRPSCGLK
jgi:DNA-binding transcriptional LysR family regulator